MQEDYVYAAVKSVVDSYDFEKVSDLTKDQFIEILSKSIRKVTSSSDFSRQISRKLGTMI